MNKLNITVARITMVDSVNYTNYMNDMNNINNIDIINDSVNHPKHYTIHPSGIECIEIARWFNFNLGSALKYIWRAGIKTNNPIEDLRKAIWYLQDEISKLEGLYNPKG